MATLPAPMEVLDLKDGETLETSIVDYQEGETTIFPPHQPQGKLVSVLRVHVPKSEKTAYPYYYDLTSKGLQAQLKPYLDQGIHKTRRFRITKHGIQPKARFTLELL